MVRTIILLIMIPISLYSGDFLSLQRSFKRFSLSETEKASCVNELFSSKGLSCSRSKIFLRAFKNEGELELWAVAKDSNSFTLLKTYEICMSSGVLGPKRMQGDYQVPEGLYYINRFNPTSNFYLSLGLNYPNESDRILGENGNLGGDIFIHGSCVTIGCIPIQDEFIKELYLICAYARNSGQSKIEVHIFPTRLDEKGMLFLFREYKKEIEFWKNLQQFYLFFEKHRKVPGYSVSPDGKYILKNE